jgi:hypothetical protein
MRRLAVVSALAVALLLAATPAWARSPRIRLDPNDVSTTPDIHKVITNVAARRITLRLRTWDAFVGRDVALLFLFDLRGSKADDRRVVCGRKRPGVLSCDVDNFGPRLLGTRRGHHPDPRDFVVKLPRRWFKATKPIRFIAYSKLDRAPNRGRYVGL